VIFHGGRMANGLGPAGSGSWTCRLPRPSPPPGGCCGVLVSSHSCGSVSSQIRTAEAAAVLCACVKPRRADRKAYSFHECAASPDEIRRSAACESGPELYLPET